MSRSTTPLDTLINAFSSTLPELLLTLASQNAALAEGTPRLPASLKYDITQEFYIKKQALVEQCDELARKNIADLEETLAKLERLEAGTKRDIDITSDHSYTSKTTLLDSINVELAATVTQLKTELNLNYVINDHVRNKLFALTFNSTSTHCKTLGDWYNHSSPLEKGVKKYRETTPSIDSGIEALGLMFAGVAISAELAEQYTDLRKRLQQKVGSIKAVAQESAPAGYSFTTESFTTDLTGIDGPIINGFNAAVEQCIKITNKHSADKVRILNDQRSSIVNNLSKQLRVEQDSANIAVVVSLKEEITNTHEQLAIAEEKIVAQQAAIDSTQHQLKDKQAVIQQLQAALEAATQSLKQATDDFSAKADSLEAQNAELQKAAEEAEHALLVGTQANQQALADMHARIAALESDLESKRLLVEEISRERDSIKDSLNEFSGTISHINELRGEAASLREQNTQLEAQLVASAALRSNAEQTTAARESQLAEQIQRGQENAERAQKFAQLEPQVELLQHQLRASNRDKAALEAENGSLKQENTQQASSIEGMSQQLEAARSKLSSIAEATSKAESALAAAATTQAENQRLQAEIDRLRTANDQLQQANQQLVDQIATTTRSDIHSSPLPPASEQKADSSDLRDTREALTLLQEKYAELFDERNQLRDTIDVQQLQAISRGLTSPRHSLFSSGQQSGRHSEPDQKPMYFISQEARDAVILAVNKYLGIRNNEKAGFIHRGQCTGFNKATKLAAADALLTLLNGSNLGSALNANQNRSDRHTNHRLTAALCNKRLKSHIIDAIPEEYKPEHLSDSQNIKHFIRSLITDNAKHSRSDSTNTDDSGRFSPEFQQHRVT